MLSWRSCNFIWTTRKDKKNVKNGKVWIFWKPFSMVVKFWKLSASSFWQTISNDLKLHIRVNAHQGNYLWLLVTFRKVPQKKVMASWNTRILMKMLSGRSNFVPQKLSKKWKVSEKQKHTANSVLWANYCNTEWTNIFRTKKMPPKCILWGKFRKSVVFSKKVVITFSHFVLGTFLLLSICSPMDAKQGVVPPWNRSD